MSDPKILIEPLFDALSVSLHTLSPEEYTQPISILHGASIGQHVRHILDLYQCLDRGLESGIVNYESRKRDPLIETDPASAIALMAGINLSILNADRTIFIEGGYGVDSEKNMKVGSTYNRELLFNFEHTVHHMALIKIGLQAIGRQDLPEGYGVAPSTLKFRKACAQ